MTRAEQLAERLELLQAALAVEGRRKKKGRNGRADFDNPRRPSVFGKRNVRLR